MATSEKSRRAHETAEGGLALRVLRSGIAIGAVMVVVQTVAHLVNAWTLDLRVDILNADSDTGAFAWASSSVTFGAALAAGLLGVVAERRRPALLSLAALLALFSLDDIVKLHERASDLYVPLGLDPSDRGLVWPLILLPLLAATFLLLWRFSSEPRPPLGGVIRLGLLLLVMAVLVEFGWGALAPARWTSSVGGVYALEVAVEEGLELAGWVLIAAGAISHLCATLARSVVGPGERPASA